MTQQKTLLMDVFDVPLNEIVLKKCQDKFLFTFVKGDDYLVTGTKGLFLALTRHLFHSKEHQRYLQTVFFLLNHVCMQPLLMMNSVEFKALINFLSPMQFANYDQHSFRIDGFQEKHLLYLLPSTCRYSGTSVQWSLD